MHPSYMLASFHGDTNGLATIPVMQALHSSVQSQAQTLGAAPKLIFGADANTYNMSNDKCVQQPCPARSTRPTRSMPSAPLSIT
jgi:hypothetical protein